DIAGNDEDVAGIAKIELLENIDAAVEPVAVVERGDAPHRLRPEPRSRTIGGGRVEGRTDKGRFEIADLADVLAVGRLHEGVDAGEGRLMAAAEEGDIAIDDGGGGFEAEPQRAPDLFVLLLLRDARQRRHRLGAVGLAPLHVMRLSGAAATTTTPAL